jgi:hypothetical protein
MEKPKCCIKKSLELMNEFTRGYKTNLQKTQQYFYVTIMNSVKKSRKQYHSNYKTLMEEITDEIKK